MAKKSFLRLIVIIVFAISGCVNDSPAASKAHYEAVINEYVHAYLSSNYQRMMSLDSGLSDSVNHQGRSAPISLQQQESQRAMSKQIIYLQALQQDKANHRSPLFNSLNPVGGRGGAFHSALYPGVVVKVMEVRAADQNMLTEHENYSAMAYVQLTYADINNSPPHNDRFIQNAVVKVYFRKTTDGIKVASYMPTEYELSLFEEGPAERFGKMLTFCNEYAMNRFALKKLDEQNQYFSRSLLNKHSGYAISYYLVSTYQHLGEKYGGFLDILEDGRGVLYVAFKDRNNNEGDMKFVMIREDGIWKLDSFPMNDGLSSDNKSLESSSLGDKYLNEGKLDEAMDKYYMALNLDEKNCNAYSGIGVAYFKKGKIRESIQSYERAVSCNDREPYYFYLIGVAFGKEKHDKEAIAYVSKSIELNNNYYDAYHLRGILYYRMSEFEKSKMDLAIACKNGKQESCDALNKLFNSSTSTN